MMSRRETMIINAASTGTATTPLITATGLALMLIGAPALQVMGPGRCRFGDYWRLDRR